MSVPAEPESFSSQAEVVQILDLMAEDTTGSA
jgi:hypothetical protein